MARYRASTTRLDPYANFRFRFMWDDSFVLGASKVSMLKRGFEGSRYLKDSDYSTTRALPGPGGFETITMERGITHDAAFAQWASKVRSRGDSPDGKNAPTDFRRDLTLKVYDETGQPADAYKLFRCWVSEFQALPDLDAGVRGVAIEMLKLQCEGWERINVMKART